MLNETPTGYLGRHSSTSAPHASSLCLVLAQPPVIPYQEAPWSPKSLIHKTSPSLFDSASQLAKCFHMAFLLIRTETLLGTVIPNVPRPHQFVRSH